MMKIYLGSLERRNANNSYVFLFAHRLYLPNVEKDRNVSLLNSDCFPGRFRRQIDRPEKYVFRDFIGEKLSRDCVNLL